jgi:hypothetical protein
MSKVETPATSVPETTRRLPIAKVGPTRKPPVEVVGTVLT